MSILSRRHAHSRCLIRACGDAFSQKLNQKNTISGFGGNGRAAGFRVRKQHASNVDDAEARLPPVAVMDVSHRRGVNSQMRHAVLKASAGSAGGSKKCVSARRRSQFRKKKEWKHAMNLVMKAGNPE